jgi:hypothetical protein
MTIETKIKTPIDKLLNEDERVLLLNRELDDPNVR